MRFHSDIAARAEGVDRGIGNAVLVAAVRTVAAFGIDRFRTGVTGSRGGHETPRRFFDWLWAVIYKQLLWHNLDVNASCAQFTLNYEPGFIEAGNLCASLSGKT
jgi:hypothetical protein